MQKKRRWRKKSKRKSIYSAQTRWRMHKCKELLSKLSSHNFKSFSLKREEGKQFPMWKQRFITIFSTWLSITEDIYMQDTGVNVRSWISMGYVPNIYWREWGEGGGEERRSEECWGFSLFFFMRGWIPKEKLRKRISRFYVTQGMREAIFSHLS